MGIFSKLFSKEIIYRGELELFKEYEQYTLEARVDWKPRMDYHTWLKKNSFAPLHTKPLAQGETVRIVTARSEKDLKSEYENWVRVRPREIARITFKEWLARNSYAILRDDRKTITLGDLVRAESTTTVPGQPAAQLPINESKEQIVKSENELRVEYQKWIREKPLEDKYLTFAEWLEKNSYIMLPAEPRVPITPLTPQEAQTAQGGVNVVNVGAISLRPKYEPRYLFFPKPIPPKEVDLLVFVLEDSAEMLPQKEALEGKVSKMLASAGKSFIKGFIRANELKSTPLCKRDEYKCNLEFSGTPLTLCNLIAEVSKEIISLYTTEFELGGQKYIFRSCRVVFATSGIAEESAETMADVMKTVQSMRDKNIRTKLVTTNEESAVLAAALGIREVTIISEEAKV